MEFKRKQIFLHNKKLAKALNNKKTKDSELIKLIKNEKTNFYYQKYNKFNWTHLMLAFFLKKSDKILKLLINTQPKIDIVNKQRDYINLKMAIMSNTNVNIIKLLVNNKNYFKKEDRDGNVYFKIAIINKVRKKLFQYLIYKIGLKEVNKKNKNGESILIFALKKQPKEFIIKLLINKKTDFNQKDKDNNSLLILALKKKLNFETIKLFINKKTDFSIRNNNNETALIIALKNNLDEKIIKILMNEKINLEDKIFIYDLGKNFTFKKKIFYELLNKIKIDIRILILDGFIEIEKIKNFKIHGIEMKKDEFEWNLINYYQWRLRKKISFDFKLN